jgi:hypothetical protein
MSGFSTNILPPGVGVPPFLINNLPSELGLNWYITGDGLGSNAYYTLDARWNTIQEIIDNGAVIKPALDGVEKLLIFPNLKDLKIVFESSTGSIRIEKVKA